MSSFDDLGSSTHGHSRKGNRADAPTDTGDHRKKKAKAKAKLKAGDGKRTADDRRSQADSEDTHVPEHIREEQAKEDQRRRWQRKHDGEEVTSSEAESADGSADGQDDQGEEAHSSSSASTQLIPLKVSRPAGRAGTMRSHAQVANLNDTIR